MAEGTVTLGTNINLFVYTQLTCQESRCDGFGVNNFAKILTMAMCLFIYSQKVFTSETSCEVYRLVLSTLPVQALLFVSHHLTGLRN